MNLFHINQAFDFNGNLNTVKEEKAFETNIAIIFTPYRPFYGSMVTG